jgi:ATP-dependent Clp protease ATP-binding subunit ClpC
MKIKIKDFFDLVKSEGGSYKIKTPSGYKLIGNLYEKLNKDCVKIVLSNGLELSGSDTHLVEVDKNSLNPTTIFENGSYWISLGNITEGELVWCENNELVEVVSYEEIGVHTTYDLEVLDGERKYISNGVVSHNCGKTAIVEGLAIKIFNGECPRNLMDKKIVSLDMTSIVAGTKYRGQFEERMKVIIEELQVNPNIIVFIDEIHTIVGAGNSSGSMDASNIFKPALARGEIQCVGATTLDEYRKNFEKDGALERRFQKVIVDPATKDETLQILKNAKDKYENYHKVVYSDEVLSLCVDLAERYITDREFPDKAFDILDEVGARSQVEVKIPEEIEKLKLEALDIKQEKLDVVKRQDYEEAANLRDKEKRILNRLETEKKKFEEELNQQRKEISTELVYDVVSNMTKIPISKLNADETKSLSEMESNLNDKVIGQPEAVSKITKSIRRNRLGIKDPNKPIGSFIFLGSTGVGKTHLAKQLAKQIFGTEDALIRIDMSEYQEKHNISRLIGSPPGYVGHEEGGQLTEQVKNKPYSVILFDEVEKANKDIFSTLLQVLDDGHLTDSLGRKINFKNCVIIMTSNIGVRKLQDFGTGIGFGTSAKTYVEEEQKRDMLKKELQKFFAPEFLNRIDEIVVFKSLNREDVKKIVLLEVERLQKRLNGLKYNFTFDESVIDLISEVGYDEIYGARPLKRAIQDKIEDYISEEVLKGTLVEDVLYRLVVIDKEVKIENEKPVKRGRKKKGDE